MSFVDRIVQRALGIEPAGPGEGIQWGLRTAFPWPAWVLLLFVIAAVAAVVWIYLREGTTASRGFKLFLAGLRLALLALALFMLSDAVLSVERMGLPYLVVLLDDSGSMAIADRYNDVEQRKAAEALASEAGLTEATRMNVAKAVLLRNDAAFLKRLVKDHKLRFYHVSGAARQVDEYLGQDKIGALAENVKALEPLGEQTRLGDGLRQVLNDLRGTPPTAVVMLTDGITTDGEQLSDAAQYARRKNVPLLFVALGDANPIRDLELRDLLVDDRVFVSDQLNFEVKLTGTGYEGQSAEVILREAESETSLASKIVTVGPDGATVSVQLSHRPVQTGEMRYVVEARELPREFQTLNNRLERTVNVIDDKVRVLLVESYPRFEFRYLKNLLERDETIELNTVLLESDADYAQEDRTALPVFPVSRNDLFYYDVLLFGDVNPSYLSRSVMQNIVDFVGERGGGFLMTAGPLYAPQAYRGTPLEPLLPIELGSASAPSPEATIAASFQPELTPQGQASPIFQFGDDLAESLRIWDGLPPLFWLFEAPDLKDAAVALVTHPTLQGSDGKLPVVVMQFYGAGKSIFVATDDFWRWRYRVGDRYLALYWVQAIRYLSRSKLLGGDRAAELTTLRREYRRGDPVRLRVRFLDESLVPLDDGGVEVVLERQGHETRRVTLERVPPGRQIFEGMVTGAAEGAYHAWLASPALEGKPPAADFRVVTPPGELVAVQMDEAELGRAANLTQGEVFRFDQSEQVLDRIPKGHLVPLETDAPVPLWNWWPVLTVFVMLLTVEWILRKRKRML